MSGILTGQRVMGMSNLNTSNWLTFSNFLSLVRGPLAFLFILDSPFYRSLAIGLAMLTDSIDGYIARKSGTTSQLGAFLDPLMDKLFVFGVACILVYEGQIALWEAYALVTRDFAVLFFALYLMKNHRWREFEFIARSSRKELRPASACEGRRLQLT